MAPDEARWHLGATVAKGRETGELTGASSGWAYVRFGDGGEPVPCDPAGLELLAAREG